MSTETTSVDLVGEETVGNLARAALLAALVGAFAYVSFPNPLSPAPVSLQVLGVFLAGIFLGPMWGAGALVLYLTAGAIGAPVFAGGESGFGALLGHTAGYLWSYPLAAGVVGYVTHGGFDLRNPADVPAVRLVGGMVVGTVIIYAFGIAGLSLVLKLNLVDATVAGAAAFLPFEAVKIAAAVGIVRSDRIAAA